MKKLQIVLAEDHAIVRDGLKLLINSQDDLEVVGEASDGAAALTMISALTPDVAIIDISMPVMNGIELVSRLIADHVTTKLLTLTANEDRGYMPQLLKLGVSGYLLKRSAADELIKAIRTVANGGRYLDPLTISNLIEEPADSKPAPNPANEVALSEREEEVLRLIAQGYSNRETAEVLGISMKTVETYRSRSMIKLGLRGRADIVRYALSRNWLREDSAS